MLSVDENDGLLAMQQLITAITAVRLYSGRFLRLGSFYSSLILLRLVMLFTQFASGKRRIIAIPTLFLLYVQSLAQDE